jgi:Fe-S cluster biogenesis protein NfuA
MEGKTVAGFAGLFRELIAIKKCRDYLPKHNCLAGHAFFLRKLKKKRGSSIIIWKKPLQLNIIMDLIGQVEEILADFKKSLQADGGDIELLAVIDGIVKVSISRTTVPVTFSSFLRKYRTREGVSCGRCQIPTKTIVAALEAALKEKIPQIIKVESVRTH